MAEEQQEGGYKIEKKGQYFLHLLKI